MGLREWWASTAEPRAVKAATPAPLTQPRRQQLAPRQVAQMTRASGTRSQSIRRRTSELATSDDLQRAYKSISYSDYVNDFINNTGFYEGDHYTMQQVEAAYRTSVYLFAALRRVANLFSEVRLVAEQKQPDGSWKRLPESHHLNMMFSSAGAKFMYEAFLYYAMYGKVLIYKRKTRKARAAYRQGKLIASYADGGIAGIHIIPNAKWDIYENEYRSEIIGFNLNEPDGLLESGMRDRDEFVYLHDFDFRNRNDAVSMVSLALNNAITNAAVARWASHYFMSGAMPLLLVNIEDDAGPMIGTEVDMLKYKNAVERIWQGLWGKFSLRAFFTDRKLNVQQAGIKAQDVMAPELNQDSLNAITSVFQIAPDLIVPPPGGTQERHKWLIMDAYTASVLPVAWRVAGQVNEDFGFDETSILRMVVAEEDIRALEAERADAAQTEIEILNAGIQTYGEAQERLKIKRRIPELSRFVNINGKFQSVDSILRDDGTPPPHVIQYGVQAFDSNIVKRGFIAKVLFDIDVPPDEDGYKWQLVPDSTNGGMPQPKAGGEAKLPPGGGGSDNPPPDGGGSPPAPTLPPGGDGGKPQPGTQTPSDDYALHDDAPTPPTLAPQAAQGPTPLNPLQQAAAPNVAQPPPADAPQLLGVEVEVEVPATPALPPSLPPITGSEPLPITPPAGLAPTGNMGEPDPLYSCLWLANDPLVEAIRAQLGSMMNSMAVKWSDPATWHTTLVYGNDSTPNQQVAVARLTPATCPPLHLRATNLITFDTPDGVCIALNVELDGELEALQSAQRVAFQGAAIEISPFSAPEAFHPHVTLGYVSEETDVPEFTCNMILEPQALRLMRGDYEVLTDRPVIKDWQALLDAPEADGTDAVSIDPNRRETRDQLRSAILNRRGLMRSALNAWQATGEPGPDLRDQVRSAVRETIALCGDDSEKAWMAIMLACERGQFDDDADLEENPILIPSAAVDAGAELKAWERFALAGKSTRSFETHAVPAALAAQVKTALQAARTQKAKRAVFADARTLLAQAQPADTNEDMLVEWGQRLKENDNLSNLLSE